MNVYILLSIGLFISINMSYQIFQMDRQVRWGHHSLNNELKVMNRITKAFVPPIIILNLFLINGNEVFLCLFTEVTFLTFLLGCLVLQIVAKKTFIDFIQEDITASWRYSFSLFKWHILIFVILTISLVLSLYFKDLLPKFTLFDFKFWIFLVK
ncbi:hypothetical protein [Bacillus sp. NPDC094106]|uniref:hypothetical protein n=1 Tax=Bacillus sp. NPDC094106 TaxID=3363949 RepID=UPI003811E452